MYYPSGKIVAVGVFIRAESSGRYLFLMRADDRYENTWALAGGRVEEAETLFEALSRECVEEIGVAPQWQRLVPLEQFTSPDGRFVYHSFYGVVSDEFLPILNQEHHGYAWVSFNHWPRPLHPGLWNTVQLDEVRAKLHQLNR